MNKIPPKRNVTPKLWKIVVQSRFISPRIARVINITPKKQADKMMYVKKVFLFIIIVFSLSKGAISKTAPLDKSLFITLWTAIVYACIACLMGIIYFYSSKHS